MRVKPVPCSVEALAPYEYNEAFTVEKGGEFFTNGELAFPPGDAGKEDGSYRTLFGPCFAHNGVIFCNCDPCVSLAFRRLTATRKPEIPGYDRRLKENQADFFVRIGHLFDEACVDYTPHFASYDGTYNAARDHHSDPHVKRLLRVRSWMEMEESRSCEDRLWLTTVKYKMKRDEIAKVGKPPRMIGDLGVAASLQGFMLTKHLKLAQASCPRFYRGAALHFISTPKASLLEEVFATLLDPHRVQARIYFCYFSDDSCVSIRHKGKTYVFNVDISKCDASHTEAVFTALKRQVPPAHQDDMEKLIEQCRLPIVIKSLSNPRNRVQLRPKTVRLYSGATITTAVNNTANFGIGVSIAEIDLDAVAPTAEALKEAIVAAAERAGYIVTCEFCPDYSGIQFLKHSPVVDIDGDLRALLNLGVLLRLSGTCKGDLPGSGPIGPRARLFQSALLNGAYPTTSFPFLDTMKKAAGADTCEKSHKVVQGMFEYKVDHEGAAAFTITNSEAFRRYPIEPADLLQLCEFAHLGLGYHLSNEGVGVIMDRDYSLSHASW